MNSKSTNTILTESKIADAIRIGVIRPTEIAKRYGVTKHAVYLFVRRHPSLMRMLGKSEESIEKARNAEARVRKQDRKRRAKATADPASFARRKDGKKKWANANRKLVRKRFNARRLKLRQEAIAHYGGKCECCGESQYEFLAIDHKNNDGAAHRKSLNSGQRREIFSYLKKQGWPEEFRVLCHNCNCAIGFYGYCPHSRTVTSTENNSHYVTVP